MTVQTIRGMSLAETAVKFINESTGNVAKCFMYGVDWIQYFQGEKFQHGSAPNNLQRTATIGKLIHSGPRELPTKVLLAAKALEKGYRAPTEKNHTDAVVKTFDCVSPLSDTFGLLEMQSILQLPSKLIHRVKQLNGLTMIGLFGRTAYRAIRNYQTIDTQLMTHEVRKARLYIYGFEFAKSISYVALGILVSLSYIAGIVAPPIAFTALSTSALVFTILNYYNERWGDALQFKTA